MKTVFFKTVVFAVSETIIVSAGRIDYRWGWESTGKWLTLRSSSDASPVLLSESTTTLITRTHDG